MRSSTVVFEVAPVAEASDVGTGAAEADTPDDAKPATLGEMGGVLRPPLQPSTLIIRLQAESCHFLRGCLDPGSGRKIPAVWHGAGAYHGVFIPET